MISPMGVFGLRVRGLWWRLVHSWVDRLPFMTESLRRARVRRRAAERRYARQRVGRAVGVVHACPSDGSGLTGCCGRTVFELSVSDRLSQNPVSVTCGGRVGGWAPVRVHHRDVGVV